MSAEQAKFTASELHDLRVEWLTKIREGSGSEAKDVFATFIMSFSHTQSYAIRYLLKAFENPLKIGSQIPGHFTRVASQAPQLAQPRNDRSDSETDDSDSSMRDAGDEENDKNSEEPSEDESSSDEGDAADESIEEERSEAGDSEDGCSEDDQKSEDDANIPAGNFEPEDLQPKRTDKELHHLSAKTSSGSVSAQDRKREAQEKNYVNRIWNMRREKKSWDYISAKLGENKETLVIRYKQERRCRKRTQLLAKV